MEQDTAFLQRVCLRNYKSIAACEATLRPLTLLVGPNGAGKSNFLDALRFVAESLRFSLDHALRDRGGIQEVRRRSGGHPNHFGLRLDFALPGGSVGHYAFQIAARQPGGFEVQTRNAKYWRPGRRLRAAASAWIDARCGAWNWRPPLHPMVCTWPSSRACLNSARCTKRFHA